jgi:hypothetical protein
MLSVASVSNNLSDPFWSTLQTISDLYRNQILIDEAPDFATVQLACMSLLVNPRVQAVFGCGDFNQRMTEWGTRSLDDLKAVFPDAEIREIGITYRQSRRLNEFSRAIVDAFGGTGTLATLPADIQFEGVNPALLEGCASQESLATWIAEIRKAISVDRRVRERRW